MTGRPLLRTSSTAVGDLAAHDGPGQHQELDARQPDGGPHGGREFLLADQRNGVDRDALAADIVPVGFGNRAHGHEPNLGTATHDDDALAVDFAEGRQLVDAKHTWHRR